MNDGIYKVSRSRRRHNPATRRASQSVSQPYSVGRCGGAVVVMVVVVMVMDGLARGDMVVVTVTVVLVTVVVVLVVVVVLAAVILRRWIDGMIHLLPESI
ncbi:hypothetical protein E2C01_045108 [Portunus trituberculatus]|uniref:Transmembrane protein n=1 Tax=Portunus trituberculatus TaxID=210409 RepID=A0A5B7G1X3_PORTR|nr:hypothetical protein [Portunus trituberculatus]